MNNLFKLLNAWANKLVIRILTITGTPKEQIDRVVSAMIERNAVIDAADRKVKARFVWVKYLIITLFAILIIYIYLKIKKLKK